MKYKITTQAIYLVLAILLLNACRKEQPNEPDAQQPGASVVYERGDAIGPVIKKIIGADGGTISSAEGRIKLPDR